MPTPTETWRPVTRDDASGLTQLQIDFGITDEMLGYARDDYEQPHMEYDAESDTFLLIYNVPSDKPDTDGYLSKDKTNRHFLQNFAPRTHICEHVCMEFSFDFF